MPDLDIFCVAYGRDIDNLELQIRSLNRFAAPGFVTNYFLVANDPSDRVRIALADILEGLRVVRSKVLLTAADLGCPPSSDGKYGWYNQQALKIEAARVVRSEWLVILDAKNHFVGPIDFQSFVSPRLRGRCHFSVKHGFQQRWLLQALEFFGVDKEVANGLTPSTTTPFTISSAIFRAFDDAFRKRVLHPQDFFVPSTTEATEFFLIASFVFKRFGSFNAAFDPEVFEANTLFTDYPKTSEQIAAWIDRFATQSPFLAVHSKRRGRVPPRIWELISERWQAIGLVAGHEVVRFLGEPSHD